jgi:hypothetical protein
MRMWVQFLRFSKNIRVCKFRLDLLSYIKKKKKKFNHVVNWSIQPLKEFKVWYYLLSFTKKKKKAIDKRAYPNTFDTITN